MRKVKILTDSVADIFIIDNENVCDKFDIDFIPLHVNINNEVYNDFTDIMPKDLFIKVEETKKTPKTSCPSPAEYIEFFKKYIDQDYDIVFFSIGSLLSGGFKSASIAKEEFDDDRIYLVDTHNISSGEGILVLNALKLRDAGLSAKEIYEESNKIVFKSKCKFVVDTMEYLHKGGRCSSLTAFIGSILQIKPVITANEGKLSVYAATLGKKRGLKKLLEEFKKDFDANNIVLENVLITHAEGDIDVPFLTKGLIEIGLDPKLIHETRANCTVGSHCGPNTIGIIYLTK